MVRWDLRSFEVVVVPAARTLRVISFSTFSQTPHFFFPLFTHQFPLRVLSLSLLDVFVSRKVSHQNTMVLWISRDSLLLQQRAQTVPDHQKLHRTSRHPKPRAVHSTTLNRVVRFFHRKENGRCMGARVLRIYSTGCRSNRSYSRSSRCPVRCHRGRGHGTE